jgi:hypothetical protein
VNGAHRRQQPRPDANGAGEVTGEDARPEQGAERQALRRQEEGGGAGRAGGAGGRGPRRPGQSEAGHTAAAGQEQRLPGRRPRAPVVAAARATSHDERADVDDVGREGVQEAERGPTQPKGGGGGRVGGQQRPLGEAAGVLNGKDQRVRQHLHQQDAHA